jgi:hypothetical protein
MFWERSIWLSLDDQQIGLQSLHRVVQGVASNGSHDTPFNFDIVRGKGAGQVFEPRFDVSRLFSARRGDGRGERPLSDGDGDALRTQDSLFLGIHHFGAMGRIATGSPFLAEEDFDNAAQQLAVFLLLRGAA